METIPFVYCRLTSEPDEHLKLYDLFHFDETLRGKWIRIASMRSELSPNTTGYLSEHHDILRGIEEYEMFV